MVPGAEGAEEDWPQYSRCDAPLSADPLRPCMFGTPSPAYRTSR